MDILCNNKASPWVNDEIKLLIKRKKLIIYTQMRDNRLDLSILNKLSDDLTNVLTSLKLGCYRQIAAELNDPKWLLKVIEPF